MDELARFVHRTNITNFSNLLEAETDPARRAAVNRLLLEEETRYGFFGEQLDLANARIRETENRATRQQELVSRLALAGHDTTTAERLLSNLKELIESFKQYQSCIMDALTRTAI